MKFGAIISIKLYIKYNLITSLSNDLGSYINKLDLDSDSETVSGAYINRNGNIVEYSGYSYTNVTLTRGNKIVAEMHTSVNAAAISLYDGTNRQAIVVGVGTLKKYEYVASKDCIITLSYKTGKTKHSALIIKTDSMSNKYSEEEAALLRFSGNKKKYSTRTRALHFKDTHQKMVQPKMLGSAVWVWNQLNDNNRDTASKNGVTFTNNGDGTWTITGTKGSDRADIAVSYQNSKYFFTEGHWYLFSTGDDRISFYGYRYSSGYPVGLSDRGNIQLGKAPAQNGAYDVLFMRVSNSFTGSINVTVRPVCIDVTLLLGEGNEPTIDDHDLIESIKQRAELFPGYVEKQIVSGSVTSINGLNVYTIPQLVRKINGLDYATHYTYNYLSYDVWVENYETKAGWRFHKNVNKILLNGTQALKQVNFNNTQNSSAWIYEYIEQKPETNIRAKGDLLSDEFESATYLSLFNTDVLTASIAYYNNTSRGFVVRVPVSGIETEEQVNAYMAEHPAEVYYLLASEEIIDVSNCMDIISLICNDVYYINTGESKIAVPAILDVFENGNRPQPSIMTIIDDDGDKHFLTDVVPMINRLKVPIATAVTVNNIGNSHFMSYEEIDECCDYGAEILCHTLDHPSYNSNMDIEEEAFKYRRSMNTLLRHGYHSCDILVFTSSTGEYESYQKAAENVFKCGIKIGGSKINYSSTNKFALSRFRIDYASTEGREDWNMSDMTSWVDECAKNGGWLILMFHTSNNIYRQRVEIDGQGNVIYDENNKPIPMVSDGQPVIDVDGTYPTMGKLVYLPMLEEIINYAASVGVKTVSAEYGYNIYYGNR